MPDKISVVIPLYNKGPYISRALNSVLNQSFQDFEVIVVDDGSTDNGAEIIRGFTDPRIHLIHQENRGVSAARNHGVKEAISDFIAFLDADDEWMPRHLETIGGLIRKYPDAGMYTTAYKIQTDDGKIRWAKYDFIPNSPWEGLLPNYFRSGCIGDFPVSASNVVIPRKIFYEMGGFHEDYWWGEDIDLFGKIALKYPIAFSWEFGALYHCDTKSQASKRTHPMEYEEPLVKTARAAMQRGDVPPEFIEYLDEYISRTEIGRAIQNVKAGNRTYAQDILKQCKTQRFMYHKIKWQFLAGIPQPVFRTLNSIHGKILLLMRKKEK